MRNYVILIALACCFGCMQLGDKKELKDLKQILAEEVQRLDSLANSPDLEVFFEGFTGDTIPQMNHVAFPLSYVRYNEAGEVSIEMKVMPEDWQFQPFIYEDDFAERADHSYTQEMVQVSADTAMLQLRGTGETRLNSDFVFVFDSVWRLDSWHDRTQ